ncbi:MAG: elongation factor G [Anaerolineales bacterium]|nr:elongation factor G [Anaerolineales bacterium]
MKEYGTEAIRNVALVGHSGSGKTSLTEAFLLNTGVTTRLGKVEDGTTVSDFEEEERRRRISISTSVIPLEYRDHKINLLDTPGFTDFVGEVKSALHVVEGALVVVDAVAGVEVGTELVWSYCDEYRLPRFVVINKLDRENASFQRTLNEVQERFKAKLIPVQLPLGEQANFKGVIGLLSMKARLGRGDQLADIPAEYVEAAQAARTALMEAAAEGDDALIEKYLGGEELTQDEIVRGFHNAVKAGLFVPVFVTSGTANIGTVPLLDSILRYLPAPNEHARKVHVKDGEQELTSQDSGPLCAYVWKTTADPFVGKLTYVRVFSGQLVGDGRVWNQQKGVEERTGHTNVARGKELIAVKSLHAGDIGVLAKLSATQTGDSLGDKANPVTVDPPTFPRALYAVALAPKTQADSTKISPTLTKLCEEDPTLRWRQEPATKQTLLEGMGDQHIDVAIRRAESKFGLGLTVEPPKVPYRESITRKAEGHHRHKKQTGGAGQFGEVFLRIEPLRNGAEYEFGDELVGMNLSRSYLPPIDKGIRSVMETGVIAGYPVTGVKVIVYDGKEHPVDSKPIAFETAGREAFKKAVEAANPVLLEPIMRLRVTVPEANMGDVLGDLNTRRARVQGMTTEGGKSVIEAEVPLAEVLRYVTDLRSLTGGRGVFSLEFERYDVVPAHIAQPIIAAYKKEKSAESEE